MTNRERKEFTLYLKACSNRQVEGVYEKETKAAREDYALLAYAEALSRGIVLL